MKYSLYLYCLSFALFIGTSCQKSAEEFEGFNSQPEILFTIEDNILREGKGGISNPIRYTIWKNYILEGTYKEPPYPITIFYIIEGNNIVRKNAEGETTIFYTFDGVYIRAWRDGAEGEVVATYDGFRIWKGEK